MFKNKPLTLLIASGLLAVLVVLTLVFQLVGGASRGGFSGNRPGGQGNFQQGQRPNGATLPNGATPPTGGGQDFQPPSGLDSNSTGTRPSFSGSNTTMKLMQLLRGVEVGAAIVITLLGVLSVVGMMLGKVWGRKWAIATSIIALLSLLPSLFQMRFGSSIIITLVKFALAAAVLVLCFLPKSRQVIVQA